MLTITHAMIIDHMHVPVILFDYEGVLADFNTSIGRNCLGIWNMMTGSRQLTGF